jgi:transcriptional regulator of NAD metabolism
MKVVVDTSKSASDARGRIALRRTVDPAGKRRRGIVEWLRAHRTPIAGDEMARHFRVSRQCLVQDIAILRAAGEQVIATPRGYFLPEASPRSTRAVFACRHTPEQTREELEVLVDCGVRVLDVIVEHPVYGELRGSLMLESRADVGEFLDRVSRTKATFLASLTGGVHLHTVEASKPEAIVRAEEALRERGILAK